MGRTLSKLTTGGWLKLNRLTDVFNQIIPVSALHAWAMQKTMEGLLCDFDTGRRDLGKFLASLLEAQSSTNVRLGEEASAILATLKGRSKAVKLAKTLRELKTDNEESLRAIRSAAIAGRLSVII